MTTKDAIKLVDQSGTKISKDKVLEALRRATTKELPFVKDAASGYSIVLVKVG